MPSPSAHERVPSTSLAPAFFRLARELALECEGGGAAGCPVAHSTRSHCTPRHRLPARTSGGGQPGRAGPLGCLRACLALQSRNRPRARARSRPVAGEPRAGAGGPEEEAEAGAVSARARETQGECKNGQDADLVGRAECGRGPDVRPVEEAAEVGEACSARKTGSVAVAAKLWRERSYRLISGRCMGAGITAAGPGEAAADAAPLACEGEREKEEDDPESEACRKRGGQSQAN